MEDEILDNVPLLLPGSPASTTTQTLDDLRPSHDGLPLLMDLTAYGSPIPIADIERPPSALSSDATSIPPGLMERSVSGGIIIGGNLASSLDAEPAEERMSTSLPSPRSPSLSRRDITAPSNLAAPALPSTRDVPAAHHTVHGFQPVPHRPAALRRTGSTGRAVGHLLPLAPMRPTSADRPRKPAPLAGHIPRHKDRFVPLVGVQPHIPEEEPEDVLPSTEDESEGGALVVTIGDSFYRRAKNWGRISVYCLAEGFARDLVEQQLQRELPACDYRMYPEAIYLHTGFSASEVLTGDVFIMDYGVVICWNLTIEQEQDLVAGLLRPCMVKPIKEKEVELNVQTLSFHYSAHEPPHIQNDIITINKRQAADHRVKLAISHALAQSSKLTLYEDRITSLVSEVRHLPEAMAKYGKVQMSRRQVAKLMGKVFLQKSEVNLLSTVLDTPEFFWTAPDHLQVLYDKVCEYLELEERVELVNSRFEIIQTMLKIWSEHSQRTHLSRLDVIVALLILLEVFLAAAQVVGMLMW